MRRTCEHHVRHQHAQHHMHRLTEFPDRLEASRRNVPILVETHKIWIRVSIQQIRMSTDDKLYFQEVPTLRKCLFRIISTDRVKTLVI